MNLLSVAVWGERACFSRPDFKAIDIISYPILTPSAARGIVETIYWKPQMQYHVREIWVINDIMYDDYNTNIVNELMSPTKPFLIVEECRFQRNARILINVRYIIRVEMTSTDGNLIKHRDQFRRRVNRGISYKDIFLGCREFQAFIGPVSEKDSPIKRNIDLGNILKFVDYSTDPISFYFMHAILDNGILRI